MGKRSIDEILNVLQRTHVIGIQGTRRPLCKALPGEEPRRVTKRVVRGFLLFEWPYGKGRYTNCACGVAIALRNDHFHFKHVQKVYVPPPAIQGRCGAVRVRKNGCFDFTPIVLYQPVEPNDHKGIDNMNATINWIDELLRSSTGLCS